MDSSTRKRTPTASSSLLDKTQAVGQTNHLFCKNCTEPFSLASRTASSTNGAADIIDVAWASWVTIPIGGPEYSWSTLQLLGSGNSPDVPATGLGATSNVTRDNEYILSGYRYAFVFWIKPRRAIVLIRFRRPASMSFCQSFKSLGHLHNETGSLLYFFDRGMVETNL